MTLRTSRQNHWFNQLWLAGWISASLFIAAVGGYPKRGRVVGWYLGNGAGAVVAA